MLIENTFTVTAPPDDLWNYLLDVEKIAPCMPGAELTETVDDTHWKGKLNMKFGPVSMSFAGEVKMAERDDVAKRVVLSAKGMEQKGKGAANATVTSWLEPGDTGAETTVKMTADIALTGAAAQMSRGLLPEISKKLTQQFADCLQASMAAEQTAKAAPVAPDDADVGAGGAPAPGKETPDVGSTAAKTSATHTAGGILRAGGETGGQACRRDRLGVGGGVGVDQELLPATVRGRVEGVVISGVVLAAGLGSRFGGTKQLTAIEGKPMAQHAVDALDGAGVDELIVVTGHDAEAVEAAIDLPSGGRFVRNTAYRDGQATSLAAAFHDIAEDSEAAVILMGDQPGITPEDVRVLVDGFRATRNQIVRLRFEDGPGPALLSREIYAEAGHLHGDVGARVLIASHPEWVHEVTVPRLVPRDIDTPDDVPSN